MFRSFIRRIISRIVSFLRLHPDVEPLIAGGFRLTNPLAAAYPAENLSFASRVIASGMWNYCFFQFYRHFAGPYWVERQYNPADPSFVPRASSLLSMNLTHRTWMGLRSPRGSTFSMIDPAGSLSPVAGSYSIEMGVRAEGTILLATRGELKVSQKPFKDLPAARSEYETKGVRLRWTVAGSADQADWIYSRVEYSVTRPVELVLGVRPFNQEGAALIHDLEMKTVPEGSLLYINKKPEVFFPAAPDELRFSNLEQGDAYFQTQPHGVVHCSQGIATGALVYRITGEGIIHFYAKSNPAAPGTIPVSFVSDEHELNRSLAAWEEKLGPGAQFECSRESWNRAAKIFSSYVLSLQTGRDITPGVFTYNQFWFRDAAYMVSALTAWGFFREAKAVIESYPSRQDKKGFFKSHEGEWDSNGQAIWTIAHYVEHSGDLELARSLYPSIRKGAVWIQKKRRGGRGILPAGFSAEHLGPADHYYWDNLWSISGLEHAAHLAGLLGFPEDEKLFLAESEAFRRDLLEASQKDRQALGVITAAPGRPVDSGMIGSICTVYPLELRVFPDEEVRRTVRTIHREFFSRDLFFHPIIHSGYNLYLSLQMAQCHLRLGDVRRARRVFKRVLKKRSGLWTYPEAIHPITGGGVMGDGFHGWAFAEMMLILREFAVRSSQGVLHLFSGFRRRELSGKFRFGPFPHQGTQVTIAGEIGDKSGDIRIHFGQTVALRAVKLHFPWLRRNIRDLRAEGSESCFLDKKKGLIEIQGASATVHVRFKIS